MENQPNTNPKNNNPITIALLGILVGLTMAFFGFYFWKTYNENEAQFQDLKNQMDDMKKEVGDSTDKGIIEEDVSDSEEYAGWKIYYNYEIGYMLRYPSNWVLKETDEWNDLTDQAVKYVSIDAPDKKSFLYFGLKNKTDDFGISNRTGVGAGDIQDGGQIAVLGTNITIKNLVYKGKIQEIFFGAVGQVNTKDGKYVFSSSLSPHDTTTGNFPDLETASKILESARIIPKKNVACVSTLSAGDKQSMTGWKTYANQKYHYAFRYPKEWQIADQDDDVISMEADGINFQFRSGPSSAIDYMGYDVASKKSIEVACQSGKSTYLSGNSANSENESMILTQFEKNGVSHLGMFSYHNIGASVSGDLAEEYGLVLKSIEFK